MRALLLLGVLSLIGCSSVKGNRPRVGVTPEQVNDGEILYASHGHGDFVPSTVVSHDASTVTLTYKASGQWSESLSAVIAPANIQPGDVVSSAGNEFGVFGRHAQSFCDVQKFVVIRVTEMGIWGLCDKREAVWPLYHIQIPAL